MNQENILMNDTTSSTYPNILSLNLHTAPHYHKPYSLSAQNSKQNKYIFIPKSNSQLLARFDCISKSVIYYDMSLYISHSYNSSCCTLPNGNIIILGCYKNSYQGDCYIFNPISISYIKVASLNKPRFSVCLHYHEGYVYGFGGIYLDPVKTCERYHLSTNRWQILPDLKQPRFSCTCISLGSFIYVIGGRYVNTIEEWDANKCRFRLLDATVLYKGCSSVCTDDRIFMICSEGYVVMNKKFEEIERKMYRNKQIVFSRSDIRVHNGKIFFSYDHLIEEFDLKTKNTVGITDV